MSKTLLIGLLVAAAVFAAFYPTHFLIADEVAYFEQAFAWSKGLSTLPYPAGPCDAGIVEQAPSDYPAGTSLLLLPFLMVAGPKAVFWCNFLCWAVGCLALGARLRHTGPASAASVYPWLFLPALVLLRTVMSDIAGFMLAALFLWWYDRPKAPPATVFAAGAVAGLGLLFRETNLLWALPFLLGVFRRDAAMAKWLWSGFVLGLIPRLLSAGLIFGQAWHIRDPGIGFSWANLPGQLAFYLFAGLVLMPGGYLILWKTRWRLRWEALAAAAVMLLVFSLYGYDAVFKSGYKGLVLQGRYLIPLLPFVTVALAETHGRQERRWLWLRRTALVAAVLQFTVVQVAGWRYQQGQTRITQALYALSGYPQLSWTPDETRKFANRLYGEIRMFSGVPLRQGQPACDTVWYAHLITRNESPDRVSKGTAAEMAFREYWGRPLPEPMQQIRLADGTLFRVWEIRRPVNGASESPNH